MSKGLAEDKVDDDSRKASPIDRLMPLVDVLLMSSMAMSRNHPGVHVGLDVEEEGMMKPGMMLNKSVKMR